jgi:hypothetical protein
LLKGRLQFDISLEKLVNHFEHDLWQALLISRNEEKKNQRMNCLTGIQKDREKKKQRCLHHHGTAKHRSGWCHDPSRFLELVSQSAVTEI